jgi:hypothetical protein
MNYTNSSSYFHIKNSYSNSFSRFPNNLDCATFLGTLRGYGVKLLRHREQRIGRRVYYRDLRGFFCMMAWPKGYMLIWAVGLEAVGSD